MAQSENKRTYYKRALQSPPATAFSSAEGREIFREALQRGGMVGFFKLIEQFTTQEEPQYCGLAALSMTLNALGIDPRRTWKGAWRWFSETMLDCCKTMDEIKRDGITLSQAACLARCNGADVSVHRYGSFDGRTFRRLLSEMCASEDRHMVVSYSRKIFKQSGDGHFSPVGGYNEERDMVLILDVARFKYAPHWVRVDDLMVAMAQLDPAIGRPRGFLLMGSRYPRESALFSLSATSAGQLPSVRSALVTSTASCSAVATATTAADVRAAAVDRSCVATSDIGDTAERIACCTAATSTAATSTAASPFLRAAAVPGSSPTSETLPAAPVQQQLQEQASWTATPLQQQPQEQAPWTASHVQQQPQEQAPWTAAPLQQPQEQAPWTAAPLQQQPQEQAPWTAAHRFIMREAPSLLQRLLAEPPARDPGNEAHGLLGGGEVHGGDQDEEHEEEPAEGQEPEAAADAISNAGASVSTVPSAESLVAALVAAAPLDSVCALLTRRPMLGTIGETRAGPCCGCIGGVALPSTAALPAPCNSTICSSRVVPLTEAAVAAVGLCCSSTVAPEAGTTASIAPANAGAASSSGSSSSSRSDAYSLDSGGSSDSSSRSGGSSNGSSCCHGEPLEHHCVPPQVQSLVADELRFTNMYKMVNYCLRHQRGCPHILMPDLTTFMHPSPAAAKPLVAPPAAATATTSAAPDAPSPTATAATAPEPVVAANAAPAPPPASASGCCGGATVTADPSAPAPPPVPASGCCGGVSSTVAAAAAAVQPPPVCDCSDLGLPELAAEKLTVLLLQLPEVAGWPEPSPPAVLGLGPGSQAAADAGAAPQAANGTAGGGGAAVRVCGRPRCRKCRQRAAAAGDRAAALGLARDKWCQMLRLAPLGLYASVPVLQEELSYIRLQLSYIGQSA